MSSSSRGLDTRLETMLCYLGWWVTGLVFLFIERRDPAVRFHAAQSLVVFGALTVAMLLSGGVSAVVFVVATTRFQMAQAIGYAIWFAAVLLWLFLLMKTWRGETWRVPIAGDLAMKIAR